MDETRFEELVKKRADQRVQERIKKFKHDVTQGLRELFGQSPYGPSLFNRDVAKDNGKYKGVMEQMASDDPGHNWPSVLWEAERKEVRQQLFGIMDEMQKTLLAADRRNQEGDVTMAPETEE